MKKIIITIAMVAVLSIALWLLSPLWNNIERNEALPGVENTVENTTPEIKDSMDSMTAEQKTMFEKETMMMKDKVMEKSDAMPVVTMSTENKPAILGRASMVARAHDVSGEAIFVETGGKRYLRFENLDTINGPDLEIYLSSNLSISDIVNLGDIKATKGNVNYEIPTGTDLTKYKYAMIWCKTFGILFSYAEINI